MLVVGYQVSAKVDSGLSGISGDACGSGPGAVTVVPTHLRQPLAPNQPRATKVAFLEVFGLF